MPSPVLCWCAYPGLEGLEPAALAQAAGLPLDPGGPLEAAVVTVPEAAAPPSLRLRLMGSPVQWLDLAAEVGGGQPAHRLARAAAALARAAGRASLGTLPALYALQPNQRVLVAGKGCAALAAARQAALLGHPVLWALPGQDPAAAAPGEDPAEVAALAASLPAGIELAPQTGLANLTGAGGAFVAWLRGAQGLERQRFGAVVLAPGGSYELEPAPSGLDPALARPLSAWRPEAPLAPSAWRQTAILVGVTQPATPAAFGRALQAALELQQTPQSQVTLFFREALVAAPQGEALYRQARQAGVLMARVGEGQPWVSADGRTLTWPDQVLGQELELAPDAVYLSEEAIAPWPAFLDNQVLWPPPERLLPEHARLDGGRTARGGFYILGVLRGTPAGHERLAEADGGRPRPARAPERRGRAPAGGAPLCLRRLPDLRARLPPRGASSTRGIISCPRRRPVWPAASAPPCARLTPSPRRAGPTPSSWRAWRGGWRPPPPRPACSWPAASR